MPIIDNPELESWKNVSAGLFVYKKVDRLTGRNMEEPVGAGRTFHTLPEERRRYEAECANEALNPFANGLLAAVRLLDSEEDAKEIASNPNQIADSDIDALFRGHHKTFEKKVGEISSPFTLRRMLERASSLDASVKQIAQVEARMREVDPEPGADVESTTVGAVGPSAGDPAPAGMTSLSL